MTARTEPVALHEVLRNLRGIRGITQGALAARLGVSQAALSRWESGRREPSMAGLQRWARALDARVVVQFAPNGAVLPPRPPSRPSPTRGAV